MNNNDKKLAQVFSRPISPWIIGLIKIMYNAINTEVQKHGLAKVSSHCSC